jgi:hypothetical protein
MSFNDYGVRHDNQIKFRNSTRHTNDRMENALEGKSYSKGGLNVKHLRKLLAANGKSTEGSRADLLERLEELVHWDFTPLGKGYKPRKGVRAAYDAKYGDGLFAELNLKEGEVQEVRPGVFEGKNLTYWSDEEEDFVPPEHDTDCDQFGVCKPCHDMGECYPKEDGSMCKYCNELLGTSNIPPKMQTLLAMFNGRRQLPGRHQIGHGNHPNPGEIKQHKHELLAALENSNLPLWAINQYNEWVIETSNR